MKTFTKNSRARLLTLSLIALSCNIQADVASNINGGDASKTLLSLDSHITSATSPLATAAQLGSPSVSVLADIATDITNATNSGSTLGTAISTMADGKTLSTLDGHITTLGTSALATAAILGTPTGGSVVDDIHTLGTSALATAAQLGSPTGASVVADIHTLGTSALATAATLGTPIGASVVADIHTLGTAALATAANLALVGKSGDVTEIYTALGAADFDSSTDSLHAISHAISLISSPDISGLATATDVTNATNSSSYLGAALLQVISQLQSDPVAQVNAAAANAALTTPLVSNGSADLSGYNGDISTALGLVATATTNATQSTTNTNAAIASLNIAIAAFNTEVGGLDGTDYLTSGYSPAQVSWALNQLNYALQYFLSQQPAS